MLFNILMFNHGDRYAAFERMEPLIRYVQEVLSSLGHEVILGYNEVYPGATQLFFEYFPSHIQLGKGSTISWPKVFQSLKQQHQVKFGVIATELLVNGTIPYVMHAPYKKNTEERLRDRIIGFNSAGEYSDFMWCFLERTAESYREKIRNTKFFPVGSLGLVPESIRRTPKDIDILFFGTATGHRLDALKKFHDAGLNVITLGEGWREGSHSAPGYLRSMIDRAKIVLNLTLGPKTENPVPIDPRFALCMRITEILSRGGLIVSETIPLDNPYKPYMCSGEIAELPALCKSILASGSWGELSHKFSTAFNAEMDAVRLCKPIVDETIQALMV